MDPWCLVAEGVRSHILLGERAGSLPCSDIEDGLIAIVDISGFTKLTSDAALRWGAAGGGEIRAILNDPFREILDQVHVSNGSAVKFAGDAAIIAWRPEGDDRVESLRIAAISALKCCIELLNIFKHYEVKVDLDRHRRISLRDKARTAKPRLQIHIGLAYGSIHHCFVGETQSAVSESEGHHARSEYFVAGPALEEAGHCLGQGGPGHLVCSFQCLEAAKDPKLFDFFTVTQSGACIFANSDNTARSQNEGLENPARPASVSRMDCTSGMTDYECECRPLRSKNVTTSHVLQSLSFVEESTAQLFRDSICDDTFLAKIDEEELNQTRQITTVFVKLWNPPISRVGEPSELKLAQSVFVRCLAEVRKFGGCLRQFNCDEKSATILMLWGMRGFAHEKGEEILALKAALGVAASLRAIINDDFSIGVATGNVYTGVIGTAYRSDGTVLGPSVNLAARIMCHKSAEKGRVLCDEETYNACVGDASLTFDTDLPRIQFKGMPTPSRIFAPKNVDTDESRMGIKGDKVVYMAGRTVELKNALGVFKDWSENRAAKGRVLIMGTSGMGKSTLASAILETVAESPAIVVCKGVGNENLQSAMYFCFAQILRSMIDGLEKTGLTPDSVRKKVGVIPMRSVFGSGSGMLSFLQQSGPEASKQAFGHSKRLRNDSFANHDSGESLRSSISRRVAPADHAAAEAPGVPLVIMSESEPLISDDSKLSGLVKMLLALQEEAKNIKWLLNCFGLLPQSELEEAQGSDKTGRLAQIFRRLISNVAKLGLDVLLLLDDLQWIDISSIELASEIMRQCPRVFVLTVSRPMKEFKPYLAVKTTAMLESGAFMTMTLHSIPPDAVESIVMRNLRSRPGCELLQSPKSVTTVCNDIFEKSGGNPFAATMLASLIPDTLSHDDQASDLATVPRDLFAAVQSQFDQLDAEFKAVLRVAAVAGQYFNLHEVAYVLDHLHGQALETRQVDDLRRTIATGDRFKYLKMDSGPGDCDVEFSHYLLTQGILQSILSQRLQEIRYKFFQYYESRVAKDMNDMNMRKMMRHLIAVDGHLDLKIKYSFQMFKLSASMLQTTESREDHKLYCKYRDQAQTPNELDAIQTSPIARATEMRLLAYLKFQAGEPKEAVESIFGALEALGFKFPSVAKDKRGFIRMLARESVQATRMAMISDRNLQRAASEKVARRLFHGVFRAVPLDDSSGFQMLATELRLIIESGTTILIDGDGSVDMLLLSTIQTCAIFADANPNPNIIASCICRVGGTCGILFQPKKCRKLLRVSHSMAMSPNNAEVSLVYASVLSGIATVYLQSADWTVCHMLKQAAVKIYQAMGLHQSTRSKTSQLFLNSFSHIVGSVDPTGAIAHAKSLNDDNYMKRHMYMGICGLYVWMNDAAEADRWNEAALSTSENPGEVYGFVTRTFIAGDNLAYALHKADRSRPYLDADIDIIIKCIQSVTEEVQQATFVMRRMLSLAQFFLAVPLVLTLLIETHHPSRPSSTNTTKINALRTIIKTFLETLSRQSCHLTDTPNSRRALRCLRALCDSAVNLAGLNTRRFCDSMRRVLRREGGRVHMSLFFMRQMEARVLAVSLSFLEVGGKIGLERLKREAGEVVGYFEEVGALWEAALMRRHC